MPAPLRVLILSGPTREYLDPVRYLSNDSSGRQGVELATAALERGHRVELIQGPVAIEPPAGAEIYDTISARDMLERARDRHPSCDVLIGVAAVSDFRPGRFCRSKQKRELGCWQLELVPTEDILSDLGKAKGRRVHAGFALETEDLLKNGLRKLESKNLDWLVANPPGTAGRDEGDYLLLGADGTRESLGRLSKRALAAELLEAVERTARQLGL